MSDLEYQGRPDGPDLLHRAYVVALLDGARKAGRESVTIDDIQMHCLLSQKPTFKLSALRSILYDLLIQKWVRQDGDSWALVPGGPQTGGSEAS